jgi:glutamine amidotransferase
MIAVVDYGLGNLRSVHKALLTACAPPESRDHGERDGYPPSQSRDRSESQGDFRVLITSDPYRILAADKVVLPGVGAFAEGIAGLRSRGLLEVLQAVATAGKPLLGICLGMQLLFEASEETDARGGGCSGADRGLALLPGQVRRFPEAGRKVPQTGWNRLHHRGRSALFRWVPSGSFVYFNHGYYCDPEQRGIVSAYSVYGMRYAAAVQCGSLYGVQFHPEKSQAVGLKILRNFVEVC